MHPIQLAEAGLVPDALIRVGVRRLLKQRLRNLEADFSDSPGAGVERFLDSLADSPIAVATDAANSQHYEVPADFYTRVLGPAMKYSSCLFNGEDDSLASAEQAMLNLSCERAELDDGMRILELGCGWGSMTLAMAARYPKSTITAVSNSKSQRDFILARAESRNLSNVDVITADMADFEAPERYDRVVSIEMFEHMRNLPRLFQNVARWIVDDGRVFLHVFCHRSMPYLFETDGRANWMGRHFFTGGMMPSLDLYGRIDEHLSVEEQWTVSGRHYWRTSEAWLRNLDRSRAACLEALAEVVGRRDAKVALNRWRIFFLACAELFRYNGGDEWMVAHYRLRRR